MPGRSSLVSRAGHVASVLCLVAAAAPPVAAQPVPPVRLSVSTSGTEGNGASTLLDMTPDGRVVLFVSMASNLVDGDTNGVADLFLRDRDVDGDGIFDEPDAVRTIRVSQGPGGEQLGIPPPNESARLSRDGRFVSFGASTALVANDINGVGDGYLYDRDMDGNGVFDEPGKAGLSLVTTGSGNGLAADGSSGILDVSADGRYALFGSTATNFSPASTGLLRCYRKDRLTTVTLLASSTPEGTPLEGGSCAMSPNGRFVVVTIGAPGSNPNWVLRDLDANTLVPIAMPTGTVTTGLHAAGSAVSAPLVFPFTGILGFSPDGSRVYLEQGTQATGFSGAFRHGLTLEYDLAAGRITREIPGLGSKRTAFRDGRTFPVISYTNFTPSPGFLRDVLVYDAPTGRLTEPVAGLHCGFDAIANRVLYEPGDCLSPGTVQLVDARYGVPLPMPDPVRLGILTANGSTVVYSTEVATILAGGADTNGASDVFAVDLESRFDRDADGLDDRWEIAMGLDYTSATGNDGPAGDPDNDGQTNLQEQTAGSHPRGAARQFMAEGADNAFFKTRLAIANSGTTAATAVVRLDGDDGSSTSVNVHVPAGARRTVFVDEITGRAPSFSTTVESSVPLVSERTMSWDATEYGAHAERASNAPATQWFLAEGATGAFSLFYLLQNPGDTAATATIRYLRPAPLAPIDRSYTLPPHSRTTLPVDQQAPELASTDVSAAISSTQPILVERAMYRSVPGQPFAAGDDSAGVTAASTTWFLAEGATGPFFDLFVLLANPNVTDADVEIRYLLPDGTVHTKTYVVAAQSRRTIYVDQEAIPGSGRPFINVAVSCAITSTNGVPIVAERTMWFPGPEVTPNFWTEANNSSGATTTARRWVLADGEAGGSKATQTYVLIANTSATAGKARVTVLPDQGTTPAPSPLNPLPLTFTLDLPPNSRTTVPMHAVQGISTALRFGVLVESIDTTPLADLVVERAMYWNSGGETWAAGTNLLATPIP